MMVSAIHQHESTTGIHESPYHEPFSHLPPHPSPLGWPRESTDFGCPASCIKLALVICFTYGNIHVSMLFSQIIPPLPSPRESKSLFFTFGLFCCPACGIFITVFPNSIYVCVCVCVCVCVH